MEVLDQLNELREGKLSRRKFTQSLMAAGVGIRPDASNIYLEPASVSCVFAVCVGGS